MKKIRTLLVVSFLTLSVLGASAQINFGVRGGLNVASLAGVDNQKYIPAFNAGVFGQYMFTESLGLDAGLFYSMLGSKPDIDGSDAQRASYLQLPVQLLYKFNVGDNLYLYPSLGIYAGYGIAGTDDYFDVAENFDFGLMGGLNLQYDRVIIGVGYQRGLTKVFKNTDAVNSNVMVSVGYLF